MFIKFHNLLQACIIATVDFLEYDLKLYVNTLKPISWFYHCVGTHSKQLITCIPKTKFLLRLIIIVSFAANWNENIYDGGWSCHSIYCLCRVPTAARWKCIHRTRVNIHSYFCTGLHISYAVCVRHMHVSAIICRSKQQLIRCVYHLQVAPLLLQFAA